MPGETFIIKILLIEDNPVEARLVQEELSEVVDVSFNLLWADTVSKGLEELNRYMTDIVLLDLTLSDSKGIETFYRIHASSPNVPVIVLTSVYDEDTAIEAVKKGAQDYLLKGRIDSNTIVRSIKYAIERHKVLMELEHYVKKLKLSEGHFRSLVEKNPDGIIIVDRESTIKFLNPTAEIFLGNSLKSLIGEQFNFPLVTGQLQEIELNSGIDKFFKLEMQVVETEWEGEIVHYVILRDLAKRKQKQILNQ